jgi:DNA-binding NarL/FixJ family response regulator
MKLPRVVLADDHTIILDAFRKLLKPHCDVVGTASDGRALLDIAPRVKPDVIVADIAMPLLNGLDACRQLKRAMPDVSLVFLTMNEDPDLASEAMRMGASGYLLKKSAASELVRAIKDAVKGKSYVTPRILRRKRKACAENPRPRMRPEKMTSRQREVIQLLVEGQSMKAAASILNVTARTIAFHKYRAMKDLKLRTTADLIQFAICNRMIPA